MTRATPVTVTILDKEYLISCTEQEREQLHAVVELVNGKLLEVKNSGSIIGAERIAIMASLNIANELLAYKRRNADYTSSVDTTIGRLQTKIDAALTKED